MAPEVKAVRTTEGHIIQDPPLARFLFSDTRLAWVWAIVRVLLGFSWLEAGWHKVTDPAWVETGQALQGYWVRAAAIPEGGRPAISFDWYRGFIQGMLDAEAHTWFAKLVAYGEVIIGIMLIVGAFVGIAAFLGAFLNWNFIMAGTASTNAVLMVAAIVLILAWKTAGWYGLDRYLLTRLGTPWNSPLFQRNRTQAPPAAKATA